MEVQISLAWAVSGKRVIKDLFKTFWGSSAGTCSILLLAMTARGHSGNQDLDENWLIIVLGKGDKLVLDKYSGHWLKTFNNLYRGFAPRHIPSTSDSNFGKLSKHVMSLARKYGVQYIWKMGTGLRSKWESKKIDITCSLVQLPTLSGKDRQAHSSKANSLFLTQECQSSHWFCGLVGPYQSHYSPTHAQICISPARL